MAKIINKVADGYQIIPRELIFDGTISDRARFVYCFMASKPEGWDFFLEPMAKEVGYSKDTLRKYINELVDGGWLVRGEQANTNGLFGAVCYELQPTKFTDTEKYRHGKNPTQDNIDIIDNIDKHSMNVNKKEKEIDKSISKKTKKSPSFPFLEELLNLGVDKQIAEDFMAVRKKKKATNTVTAFKRLQSEIEKSGMSANDCIKTSVEHDWKGFRVEWLNNLNNNNNLPVGMIIHGDRNELYEADKKNLW